MARNVTQCDGDGYDPQKGMVGKKSRGLSWRVFALMAPKVGPMALVTSDGLEGI